MFEILVLQVGVGSASGLGMGLVERSREVLSFLHHRFDQSVASICGIESPLLCERELISSGCEAIDLAVGGGFPRGRLIEIYGAESTGKTTLALHLIAQAQQESLVCTFVDAEYSFEAKYAASIGVDLNSLVLVQPDYGEQALAVVEALTRQGASGLIVVDSVAALIPKVELDGEMGEHHIGVQARMMNQAMRKLVGAAARSQTAILFINQVRHPIETPKESGTSNRGVPNEVTPGGNALRHQASLRLHLRSSSRASANEPEALDGKEPGRPAELESPPKIEVALRVTKNKVAAVHQDALFEIQYGRGIVCEKAAN